jgi:RNase P protein component
MKAMRIELDDQQNQQVKHWVKRNRITIARLVRRLLLLIPYYKLNSTDLIVLKLPKATANDPIRLEQFLLDANEEIREHYR